MTIITKPITEKKSDKLEQPLVDNLVNETLPVRVELEANDSSLLAPPSPRYLVRARRVAAFPTLCLFLTALLVMSIGIMGGVYIYQQYARAQRRFHGYCSIPVPYDEYYKSMLVDDSGPSQQDNILADSGLFKGLVHQRNRYAPRDSIKEEFEIDLEFENYETITVPDFHGGRTGRFIHDFSANKTGIVDIDGRRCFVMPLNRDVVLPPRSLYDLINKIWDGYYEVNTETVRETMRVVVPRISDFSNVGVYITRECRNVPTYMLEKATVPVYKRSAQEDGTFSEFAGHNIQEINIVNMAALEEHERNNPLHEDTPQHLD